MQSPPPLPHSTPACPYLLWAEWKQQRTTTKNKMIEVTTRTTAPRTLRTEEERNESEKGSWEGTERERKRNRETERDDDDDTIVI